LRRIEIKKKKEKKKTTTEMEGRWAGAKAGDRGSRVFVGDM
jgi:hypothetical protein